jgi:hypothetical protein
VATIRVTRPDLFPAGSQVGIYPAGMPHDGAEPASAPIASGTVDSGATLSVTSQSLSVSLYTAHAVVDGVHRYLEVQAFQGLELPGRFDPLTRVRLVHCVEQPGSSPPLRPHEGATVVESLLADSRGSVTFAAPVEPDDYSHWILGRAAHSPLVLRAGAVASPATGNAQPPLAPDVRIAPRAPERTVTTSGDSCVPSGANAA